MSKNNLLPKSVKRFIREEKARIRAQFFDSKKQEEMINELYKKFLNKPAVEKPAAEPKKEEKKPEKPAKKTIKKSDKKTKNKK